ncbi:DUF427 domain-containing protein [Falsiroseomonas sp.]|uniref:DUF427 domain-containing protein n=1 Tax=Falsiroseomonas sp. TaxID=2870721 RepID=UPI003F7101C1
MARAIWNGTVVAESDRYEVVEGNVYFPPASVRPDLLRPSSKTTVCGWKGLARYHDVVVDGQVNPAAAWYYPEPKAAAAGIKDHIAFWQGVRIER